MSESEGIRGPRVAIVMLSWNNWRDTLQCVESLIQMRSGPFDVVLVDNHSTDGSLGACIEWIELHGQRLPVADWVGRDSRVLAAASLAGPRSTEDGSTSRCRVFALSNSRNLGFAAGNNVGLEYSLTVLGSDYVMMLNNDTVVAPGFLSQMCTTIQLDERIGIVGPKVMYFRDRERIGSGGGSCSLWTGKVVHFHAGELDVGQFPRLELRQFVSGTCLMVTSRCLNEIGPLDPFFFYGGGEDVDLCIRAREHGFLCVSTPKAVLWHKGEGRDTLTENKPRLLLYDYYSVRNRLMVLRKHTRSAQFIAAVILLPVGFSASFVSLLRIGISREAVGSAWAGILNLLRLGLVKAR